VNERANLATRPIEMQKVSSLGSLLLFQNARLLYQVIVLSRLCQFALSHTKPQGFLRFFFGQT
jgi:hypothetical protein